MMLADLYTRDGQWGEAVDRLTQVIVQGPPDDVLVEAHVRWRQCSMNTWARQGVR